MDSYIRATAARSALAGTCRETGYAPDVQFLRDLRQQAEEWRAPKPAEFTGNGRR